MGIVLSEVEVQAPYAGALIFATIEISGGIVSPSDDHFQNVIRPGDLLKLNYQGPFYRIGDDAPTDAHGFCNTDDWDLQPTPRDTQAPVPYQNLPTARQDRSGAAAVARVDCD